MFDLFTDIWSYLQELAVDAVISLARRQIKAGLEQGLRTGSLRLEEYDHSTIFGQQNTASKPSATIIVKSPEFWLRIFLRDDIGFSEAFMHGDFDTPDLRAVIKLWVDNHETMETKSSWIGYMRNVCSAIYLRVLGQTMANAKQNAVTGYDTSNNFFKSMLSKEMTYSSGFWPEELGGPRGDLVSGPTENDLETAQMHKIHHVLRKARVKAGDRVLEFGSGWGAMAIEAAKLGATVDTLTLSIEQKKGAEERIRSLGLEKKIRVHLLDYRKVPEVFERASFDSFIAVEMVEAVGIRYMDQYWKVLDYALKPKAVMCVIATCQPEHRFTLYQTNDFARYYQWPNAFCFSSTWFLNSALKAVRGRFVVESVEDQGIHYPRTLREWNRRLQKNWNEKTISGLLQDRPDLNTPAQLSFFKRNFEYMCAYTEAGYAAAYLSLVVFTFARPEYVREKCD